LTSLLPVGATSRPPLAGTGCDRPAWAPRRERYAAAGPEQSLVTSPDLDVS